MENKTISSISIVALLGVVATLIAVMTPIVKLNTTITELNTTMKSTNHLVEKISDTVEEHEARLIRLEDFQEYMHGTGGKANANNK